MYDEIYDAVLNLSTKRNCRDPNFFGFFWLLWPKAGETENVTFSLNTNTTARKELDSEAPVGLYVRTGVLKLGVLLPPCVARGQTRVNVTLTST